MGPPNTPTAVKGGYDIFGRGLGGKWGGKWGGSEWGGRRGGGGGGGGGTSDAIMRWLGLVISQFNVQINAGAVSDPPEQIEVEPPLIPYDCMRPVRSLPVELHYLIIHFVFLMGYYPSIASCHLVSRTWNCECRGKWPRTIRLSRQNASRHLLRPLRSVPSHLIDSVKELQIRSDSSHGMLDIYKLANTFPGVEVIQFASSGSSIHPHVSRCFTRLFRGFSNLRVLQLHGLEFQSLKDLARLNRSATSVEELVYSKVKFRAATTSTGVPSVPVGFRFPRRILLREMNKEFLNDQVWLWAARKSAHTGDYQRALGGCILFGLNHGDAEVIRQFLTRIGLRYSGTFNWESSRLSGCKHCE